MSTPSGASASSVSSRSSSLNRGSGGSFNTSGFLLGIAQLMAGLYTAGSKMQLY